MRKRWVWLTAAFVVVLITLLVASFLIDEPLRGYMERKLNANLEGYTARLGALDFHPLGFSLDLEDLVIVQNENPDPPVAAIPQLSASVQWRALLAARVVADFIMDRPAIYINRKQTKKEMEDEIPVQERGWQEALQAIYPLKINEFKVNDGEVTYVDAGSARPLYLSQLNFRAANIRNIWAPDRVYPSDLYLEGKIFDSGQLLLDGQANFLAEPHAGVDVQLTLENVELDYFKPLAARYNITLRNGTLRGTGRMEYAPSIKVIHLQSLTIQGVQLTYTHTARSAPAEKKAAQKTVQAAQEVSNNPAIVLRADQLDIVKSTFGFQNKETNPDYRLFLADAEFHLRNFTNHLTEGTTVGKLTGEFMGSGAATVGATFRPETNGPDFDLAVRIEQTPMRLLNNLWRAYGDFDVVGGLFSFYTELQVKNGAISGYVKPLFKDIDVYDRRQDEDKGLFQQIYEGLIGGISWLLENPPRDEVATVTTVSGRLENPQTSTWEAVGGLVQNAFFKAILPGFEKATGHPRKDKDDTKAQAMASTAKTQPQE